jgi:hypothetical protein
MPGFTSEWGLGMAKLAVSARFQMCDLNREADPKGGLRYEEDEEPEVIAAESWTRSQMKSKKATPHLVKVGQRDIAPEAISEQQLKQLQWRQKVQLKRFINR